MWHLWQVRDRLAGSREVRRLVWHGVSRAEPRPWLAIAAELRGRRDERHCGCCAIAHVSRDRYVAAPSVARPRYKRIAVIRQHLQRASPLFEAFQRSP
jgi:hypothetical protein